MVPLRPAHRVRAYRPRFEVLEARHLLSTYVVDRLTDTGAGSDLAGDLRYCINHAADGDAITFGVTGTINLAGELYLDRNISIEGPGADLLTVSGPGYYSYPHNFRDFRVREGATVSVSGLAITTGYAPQFDIDMAANLGGGIANFGTLTLSNSTVTGNTLNPCADGNSCFDGPPPSAGGGIFNGNADGTAVLTIINSTVSDNGDVFGQGGGIANGSLNEYGGEGMPGGTVILSNSTVSGNSGRAGGGIFNSEFAGMMMVTNSTVSGNFANFNGGGGIYNLNPNRLVMGNTILAGNHSQNGNDLYGDFTDAGYNLFGVDPRLGPLQDNGGPTPTMAVLAGSPALNAGDPTQLGVADQRGVLRTGGVNIGAYQASATAFVLSAPDTVDPGAPFDLTVAAVDPFGQPAYGYTGTVTFATTDPDPGVVLPADYTFTPDDQGAHTFGGGVTLMTPGDQTITATDTSDDTVAGSATVTVTGGQCRAAAAIDAPAAAAAPAGDHRAADAGQALAAGFFEDPDQPAHLKRDADLAPLWPREDFRPFIAALAAAMPEE
jgi:hypothetical protein